MRTDRDELRIRMAFAVIEGSAGIRAAEHAYEFKTAKWTDALRSADAALTALDDAGWQVSRWNQMGEAPNDVVLATDESGCFIAVPVGHDWFTGWAHDDGSSFRQRVYPTHFMPLPSPPKQEPST